MTRVGALSLLFLTTTSLCAQPRAPQVHDRCEAEDYVVTYARHYRVPVPLVRAIIERESNWQARAVSSKGARGLMQLMPGTARRLGVSNSYNINQNIAGGVRYLAWLMRLFHGDLRLVSAAYYAGEDIVARFGLSCRNHDVVSYVTQIRTLYLRQTGVAARFGKASSKRVMR